MALFRKKRKYASVDFGFENLPQTRKKQFFDLLKHRYNLIFIIGLVLTSFAIPLFLTIFFEQNFKVGFSQMAESGEITQEEHANSVLILTLISNAVYIIDFMIMAIALSGINRIFKQLIWGEPVYFGHDFKLGIKQNIKPYLLNAVILGIIYSICSIVFVYYGLLSVFGIAIVLLTILITIPLFLINMVYVPIYDSKIKSAYKNSLLMFAYMKYRILVCGLIFIFPALVLLIPLAGLNILFLIVVLVFVYPLVLLGFHLYMYDKFDSTINKTHYKDIVRKGLYNGKNK